MRRGQTRPQHDPRQRTFSKRVLIESSGLSSKSFDTIRKAARIKGPPHGDLGFLFSEEDVRTLIARAESGTFSERGRPAAAAWKALLDAPPEADEPGDDD